MARCRYHTNKGRVRCDLEATTTLEGEFAEGCIDVAELCEAHRQQFLAAWQRMQNDAAELKERGFAWADFDRIMLARVNRAAYETEPTEIELFVRSCEERFLAAKVRRARVSKGIRCLDLAFDTMVFTIECRPDGTFCLEAFPDPQAGGMFGTTGAVLDYLEAITG